MDLRNFSEKQIINLHKANNYIWNNNWHHHIIENTINYKTNATNKIYDSYFFNVFQYKT